MLATVRLAGSSRHFAHPPETDPDRVGALSDEAARRLSAVTVHLREASPSESLRVRHARQSIRWQAWRNHLTTAELRDRHGAAFNDIAAVAGWATAAGLDIGAVDEATARLELTGSLGDLAAAFSVTLEERRATDPVSGRQVTYHDHRGELRIPAALDGVVTAVIGLNDRPLGRPRLAVASQAAVLRAFTPAELAEIYDFPVLEGGGAGRAITVGVAELGGAVSVRDLAHVLATMPRLRVIEEGIHGAGPRPDPFGADTEVALDWQVIARVIQHCAPQADLTLVLRYAPNTERGFTDLAASFASDGRDYAAVSTSWGSPEDGWSPSAMEAMDRAFQLGAARGIAHCVAAGDNGSADGRHDGRSHADHPASAPHALGCGGTTMHRRADGSCAEVPWNETSLGQGATGGGVSAHFPTPHYQSAAGIAPLSANDQRPGRGIPDVAAVADPLTGYRIHHDGADITVGGTSAVAPLWSALLALVATERGHRVGFAHPGLYAARDRAFNDVVAGANGAYRAIVGWDAVTGLGSPRGRAVSEALAMAPPAPSVKATAVPTAAGRGGGARGRRAPDRELD